jgi:hypothetical protein
VDLPGFEGVFVAVHVDARVDAARDELDTFKLEAGALFAGGRSAEFDFAAGTEDAMPGERVGRIGAEKAGNGAMIARISGCGGDCAVGADFACGDGKDHAAEGEVALVIWAEGRAEELAFAALEEELIDRLGPGRALLRRA